jgi:hypothetical protein
MASTTSVVNETYSTTSTLSPSRKINVLEYIYVLILIIYAAHANKYVLINSLLETPITALLPVVYSAIIFIKWRVVFEKNFIILVIGFFIYFIALSVKFDQVQPTFFLNYLFQFFIAFSAIKALRFNFFKIYESILFYLAIIGLFFWMIQVVAGGDRLFTMMGRIPAIDEFSNVSGFGLNAFFYSVQPTFNSLIYSNFLPRNCGFAWEPGGFAVFLSLAIFCNLFFSDPKGRRLRFWVLTAALITTQSTTGYLIFIVTIFYYFFDRMSKIMILLFPVILGVLVFLFSLPFMSEKIVKLINETNEVDAMVVRYIGKTGEAFTPQRFSSFMITMIDFKRNPVLGLGGHIEESYTVKIGSNISPITGAGILLAQFGIIGCLFFVLLSLGSSFYYANHLKANVRFLFLLMILAISISYTLIFYPLMMIFWMYVLFAPGAELEIAHTWESASKNEHLHPAHLQQPDNQFI